VISIVVPAYNEEKRIGKLLENYGSFFEERKKIGDIDDFEILIIINNTTDKTEEVVNYFHKKYREIRYLNFKEGGKGFAIIRGFRDALKNKRNKLIGFVDGDMSTPPEAFYDLIKKINGYDGVIANRWNKKSVVTPKQSYFRRFISRGYNLVVRALFLFPYADTQCGAKLFKREILEKNINKFGKSKWGFDIVLLYCLRKESHARIISIPTLWHDEIGSHINLKKTPIMMFVSAIRLRLIHSPFKFVVRFYKKLPDFMKLH
jgi:glycosyltransferase involved in cell wall biosynthesis